MADRQYLPLAEPFPPADTPQPQLPWRDLPVLVRPRRRLEAVSPSVGQADPVPSLIAEPPVLPVLRPRVTPSMGGTVILLAVTPFPGDLATTVVAGARPWVAIPSGMTPGAST